MLSPARRRQCVDHLQAELGISERRACAVAGQHRSTQRKRPRGRDDEEALTAAIIRLASRYGRYGYRRVTALLRTEGWHVNAKRVQRIWRREGLKVPQKQPKRGRPVAQRRILHPSAAVLAQITSGPMTSSWIEHTMSQGILRYAINSICPKGVDVRHGGMDERHEHLARPKAAAHGHSPSRCSPCENVIEFRFSSKSA